MTQSSFLPVLALSCCFALLPASNSSQAQEASNPPHAIIAIETANANGNAVLRIVLDRQPVITPEHFALSDPARIVLDLAASTNATGSRHADFNFPADSPLALLRSYDIAQTRQRTRIVFHLAQQSNYAISTEPRGIVISVAPPATVKTQPNRISATTTVRKDKPDEQEKNDKHGNISLNFQSIDVRTLLQLFADFSGINIVASDSVTGTISLRLQQVPWQQALDIILQARGLEMRRHGTVIWIAPRSELLAMGKGELEQRAQSAALEPLQTEVFQLNYQKAETVRKLFAVRQGNDADAHPHLLSRRGSTLVDQRTNQLFVTDTPAVLERIRKLIARIDIASRQVQIEARIVEAEHTFSRNLGVRLGFTANTGKLSVDNNYIHSSDAAINLPASSINAFKPGSVALSLFGASADHLLNLELSALEADGRGEIISSPRVVTADQQAALIEQGEEIPYQQSTSSGATSVAFKKANLKLEVTPQITPDHNVILAVDISKDSRGIATPGGLAINTKHVKTQVQVENGGTVVIGGIYTQHAGDTERKVPLLGDLPLLGHLFRNSEKVTNKTELLIFLTPKIITDDDF
jgi:type IV pilus assembly protein PilQ